MPRVSIVIPVYNGEATVAAAIDSVLAQSYRDFQLIVSDDGSTDGTAGILKSYGDRVSTLRRANSGPAAARNAAVAMAVGEYLAFLDADDKWRPDFLARMVPILDDDRECVMVYCNVAVMDSEGDALGASLIGSELAHAPSMDEMLARMWPIMPSAALIRRSAFERCCGFAVEFRWAAYEDAYLALRLREQGHFHYIADTLAEWRFSLFPNWVKSSPRGTDPLAEAKTFARLVTERYKIDPARLVGARFRAGRSLLGYAGLTALRRGDRLTARRAFAAALELDPHRLKNRLRLMKTYLPLGLARLLSGRTGRREAGTLRTDPPG